MSEDFLLNNHKFLSIDVFMNQLKKGKNNMINYLLTIIMTKVCVLVTDKDLSVNVCQFSMLNMYG